MLFIILVLIVLNFLLDCYDVVYWICFDALELVLFECFWCSKY